MADPATNLALIQQETQARIDLENGTKAIETLTPAERRILENAIYPIIDGYRVRKSVNSVDYTIWEIGDEILNIDDANKLLVIGRVLDASFDPSIDLDNTAKFDNYFNSKPSI